MALVENLPIEKEEPHHTAATNPTHTDDVLLADSEERANKVQHQVHSILDYIMHYRQS